MLCRDCLHFCHEAWSARTVRDNGNGTKWVPFEIALHPNWPALEKASASGCSLCGLIYRGLSGIWDADSDRSGIIFLKLVTEPWRGIRAPFLNAAIRSEPDEDTQVETGRAILELHQVPASSERLISVLQECAEMDNDSTDSECSFKLAYSWLEDCMIHHLDCTRFQGGHLALPSRVIDVGPPDGSQEPRLVEGKAGSVSSARYVTLSHCWGKTDVLTTTSRTLAERLTAIPVAQMPQTFRDAVKITRRFGFRYLWIDSLCILQDSQSDWESESARMWDTYRNAVFNIAAKHSSSSTGGCFGLKNGLFSRPSLLHFQGQCSQSPRNEGILMCASLVDSLSKVENWPTKLIQEKSSLDERAWVLQEQVLSTRTLQYHKGWVSWHCLAMDASEIVPIGIRTLQDLDHIGNLQAGILTRLLDPPGQVQKSRSDYAFHDSWYKTVKDFTTRELRFPTDRLIALSGVANAVEKATGDVYLAGLWKSWLHTDLLWSCLRPSSRFQPPLAPSWSWASVTGSITWTHVDHRPLVTRPRLTWLADIMNSSVKGSPSTQHGKVQIQGDLRPMFLESKQKSRFCEAFRADNETDGWESSKHGFFGIKWYPDEKLGPKTFIWFLAIAMDEHVYCLGLLPTRRVKGECRRVGFAIWEKRRWFVGSEGEGFRRRKPRLQEPQPFRSRAMRKLTTVLSNNAPSHETFLPEKSEYVGFSEVRRMTITIV